MAVPPETQTSSVAAAAMENREAKRSKKRSIKPSEADSSVELTHSKKKKKQTTKPTRIQADTNPTDSDSIATQEVVAVVIRISFILNECSNCFHS